MNQIRNLARKTWPWTKNLKGMRQRTGRQRPSRWMRTRIWKRQRVKLIRMSPRCLCQTTQAGSRSIIIIRRSQKSTMKQQRLKNCATPMSLQGLGRSWISSYCRSTMRPQSWLIDCRESSWQNKIAHGNSTWRRAYWMRPDYPRSSLIR